LAYKDTQGLSCFLSYDVRGEVGINIDENIVYRIARSICEHFKAKHVVIGYDARKSSPAFAKSATKAAIDSGTNVIDIGLAGTEEVYWAVTQFSADAGIEITASHNPINFNGLKFVKEGSQPLDKQQDFLKIKRMSKNQSWKSTNKKGTVLNYSGLARELYIKKISTFVSPKLFKPLKIVVNCGNGAAGPTLDALIENLSQENFGKNLIKLFDKPDHNFPNGIPNPLIPENRAVTSEAILKYSADFGVAFDGDFDRCFFFDEKGRFIPGEYIVGLIAKIFLRREKGASIIFDPRVVFYIKNIIENNNGQPIISKTGHSHIKKKMREADAIYGGEMSAHHYFRDFSFCDSGMIPFLLITEFLSLSKNSLGQTVEELFKKFPSSGEHNFSVSNPEKAILAVTTYFSDATIDQTDGWSFLFPTWSFNIRKSNTEPLVRLNVESYGDCKLVQEKLELITELILGAK
tara:strand:+ start:2325 stop:3710 length:1386 start_codon:yes stop_codon:yes gene_type:complete